MDSANLNNQNMIDISENSIRETMPEILDILLIDRTTSTVKKNKNIIWANENYISNGAKDYAATAEIRSELITGIMSDIIKPRALKSKEVRDIRTKSKAEVFTPTWIVKQQNDQIDENYRNDDLLTYINRSWLEITCGEAPYMASRYDMESGKPIPLLERVGFVDRKLRRINQEVDDKAEWQRLVELAFKSSYGFEWSGDSLLLARENLLYTYRDYYFEKWQSEPLIGLFEKIAVIISHNVFQMDGLKYIIPLSERLKKVSVGFDIFTGEELFEEQGSKGKRVKIMNWQTGKQEFFDKNI